MKRFITIISLITFTQVSYAGAGLDYKAICKYLKETHENTPDADRINHILFANPLYRDSLESSLNLAINKFYEFKLNDAEDFCREELRIISRAEMASSADAILKNTKSDKPVEITPVDSAPATSEEMTGCQPNITLNSFDCKPISALELPPDLEAILRMPIMLPPVVLPLEAPTFTRTQCDCLESNVKRTFRKQNMFELESMLYRERSRINDLIFNAAGKKIMNQFAANMEDVNFFRTNNVSALKNDATAKSLMCNNLEELKSATHQACGTNNVSDEKVKARVEKLLGAFGGFKDAATLDEKFIRLQDEIMNIKLDPKKVDAGKSGKFTRSEYDQLRYGAYKGRPEVKFLTEVTDRILNHKKLGPIVQQRIREEKKPPGYAIFDLLKDESNPEVKKLLEDLVDKHKKVPFYVNLGVRLESAADDLESYIRDAYDLGTDMHPGLKAMYKDTELFDKVREAAKSKHPKHTNTQDLISAMESNPELLTAHYAARCEKFKKNFIEAVCSPHDDYIRRTNPEDLNKLLTPFQTEINQTIKDLLICRMRNIREPEDKNSVFTRLSFNIGDKLNQSDYWERKSQNGDSGHDRFSAIAKVLQSGNSASTKYLSELTQMGREMGTAVPEIAKTLHDKTSHIKTSEIASAALQSQTHGQSATTQSESHVINHQSLNNHLARNYAAAPPTPVTEIKGTKPSREIKDTRMLLRDFLANEGNKQAVEQHLANTSDAQTAELMRLKDLISTDKMKMQELISETEKIKLRTLQSKVQNLEQEYEEIEESIPEEEHFQNAAYTTGGSTTATTGGNIAGPAANTAARASTSSRSIASNAISSNAVTGNERESSPIQKSQQGILIIDSGKVMSGEIKQEQLNQEVMSFAKLSSVDADMLKQVKEKGLVLKFRTIENGKEVLKEMKVEYATLTPEVKQFLEKQIALKEKAKELKAAQRAYSYSALKQILGVRTQQSAN